MKSEVATVSKQAGGRKRGPARLTKAGLPDKRFGNSYTTRVKPQGKRPGQLSIATMSFAAICRETLEQLGGIDWLVEQCKKHPTKGMDIIAKGLAPQAAFDVGSFTYVVQQLQVPNEPVPGVLNSPIAGQVVDAKAQEVANVE